LQAGTPAAHLDIKISGAERIVQGGRHGLHDKHS